MDNQTDTLNYEFKYKIFKAKSLLSNLNPDARDRSLKWLEKLSDMKSNIQEMKMRNELLDNLIFQLQQGKFGPPFNGEPPTGPVSPSASSMLTTDKRDGTADQSCPAKPFINQFSPDGGAFLTAQPVPRCGAFCYLAVTSRERNKN